MVLRMKEMRMEIDLWKTVTIPRTTTPVVCGNTQPDWIGSLNNLFRYKNFNANILIDTKWGGDLYSVTKWFGDYSGITEATVKDNLRETGAIADGIDIKTGQKNTSCS